MDHEIRLCDTLAQELINNRINASNTVIITVSADYSSILGQHLRHALTRNKQICDGFAIDVPYPDETWDAQYVLDLQNAFENHQRVFAKGKTMLLVEAGVIRGSNYKYVTDFIHQRYSNTVKTLALFENNASIYKSDYVGEYYDDISQDLTFWWERDNKHWPLT